MLKKIGEKTIFKDGRLETVTNALLYANFISSEEVEKAIQDGFSIDSLVQEEVAQATNTA